MTLLFYQLSTEAVMLTLLVNFIGVKQDLQDGLNYGLFCPPDNGRAGKFMDEERLLTDYALPGPIGYLEVTVTLKLNRNSFRKFNNKSSHFLIVFICLNS